MDKENLTGAQIEHEATSIRIAAELVVLLKKVELLKKQREIIDTDLVQLARPDYQVDQRKFYFFRMAQRQKQHNKDWKNLKSRRSSSDAHQRF